MGWVFSHFSEIFNVKKTGQENEATEAVFAIGNCESCTRPISTNPGSTEAGVHGLKSGICYVARRLEVVAVDGLLWISWCALGGAGFVLNFVDPEQSASTR